ncbi:hypothetical protein DSM104299_03992 [Baekduia alba]|uniref:hypothetical protein n=1 Tax=Baekduia alba TaxID=2997333 RepID=UPI00233F8CB6|nr:hypothetical protein [Baekduia alba]WCB95249.1 hypothetical protein DSM104299_03992 [Baekduia alba]
MRTRFHPGSAPPTDGPVVVSYTEFTARRLWQLPGIAWAGFGLRRGWWAMPGALGVVLYVDVRARRGGSMSAWSSAEDLRRFVALPRHVAIMRRYRTRVSVRATTWTTEGFRPGAAFAEGRARLATAREPVA